jgi:hypothetical protein
MAFYRFVLTHRRLITILVSLLVLLAAEHPAGYRVEIDRLGAFTVSGPCIHENLALYPVHAEGEPAGDVEFMTLAEGLESGKVVVNETQDVNRLTIRNRSDRYVFIQAGDIVRGGKQDRLLAHDLILPPNSGKVPIGAFCVESGRWTRRGDEAVDTFSASTKQAVSNKMKLAFRDKKSQGEVWNEVAKVQAGLTEAVEVRVGHPASPTSMELALDNRKVQQAVREYHTALGACVSGRDDIVGIVAVVDGRVRSASIYAWRDLFTAMWPKTLSSLAAEAIAAEAGGSGKEPPTAAEVRNLLDAPADAKSEVREIGAGLQEQVTRYEGAVRFVSHDADLGWARAEVLSTR